MDPLLLTISLMLLDVRMSHLFKMKMVLTDVAHHKTRLYRAMESVGMETGAFSQLTRAYMEHTFNPNTPDAEGVKFVQPCVGMLNETISPTQVLLVRSNFEPNLLFGIPYLS